jgi:hypothetical protein
MKLQSSAGGGRLQEPCGAHERVRVLYAGAGGCKPERWVMVEEAHLHHARWVPPPEKRLRGKESS